MPLFFHHHLTTASAFNPDKNPLNIPIVQVSQYDSPDVDQHYRLGEAVAALRDENVVIIGAGMSVHNLRDMRIAFNSPRPLPYVATFDNALKPAMEAPPAERQARLAEVAKRPDAHQAHPVSWPRPASPPFPSSYRGYWKSGMERIERNNRRAEQKGRGNDNYRFSCLLAY